MSILADTAGAHAPEPAATRATRTHQNGRAAVILATGFLILVAGYMLLPVYWLIVSSTKSQSDLVNTFGFWFAHIQLAHNLHELFTEQGGIYWRWLLNSLLYAGLGAAVGTGLAAMAGYALAKYTFRGKEAVFSIILGGVLLPATALALPLFLMFAKVGATNSFWSVFLPSIISPFGVYLSRIFASGSVPDEILEAARIDGSGELRTFFTISLRLMSPAMVTIFLFQFVVIWNNFLLPLVMLQDSRLYPVTLGLFTWQSQISRDPQLQVLTVIGSLVSVVPLVIAFLSLQKYWRAGLSAGAVK